MNNFNDIPNFIQLFTNILNNIGDVGVSRDDRAQTENTGDGFIFEVPHSIKSSIELIEVFLETINLPSHYLGCDFCLALRCIHQSSSLHHNIPPSNRPAIQLTECLVHALFPRILTVALTNPHTILPNLHQRLQLPEVRQHVHQLMQRHGGQIAHIHFLKLVPNAVVHSLQLADVHFCEGGRTDYCTRNQQNFLPLPTISDKIHSINGLKTACFKLIMHFVDGVSNFGYWVSTQSE
jgi:hypothetical protein